MTQRWIFTVKYYDEAASKELKDSHAAEFVRALARGRHAVVGAASALTVEAALDRAKVPEHVRAAIRSNETVRLFIEGGAPVETYGYYVQSSLNEDDQPDLSWTVCFGPVHEVLD